MGTDRASLISVLSVPLWLAGVICALQCSAHAQVPTGIIAGVVTDPAGAHVADARVILTNSDTGLTRNLTTSTEGNYIAPALPPGVYRLTAEATGFRSLERLATVEAGTITTVNFTLKIGELTERVSLSDAAPLINYEQHQIGGLVNRRQIETLPLNGRNFLDLAKLEPGVTNPIHGSNNRIFVPMLGAGLQSPPRIGYTRVTVDGGDINLIGTPGAVLQVSQEAVQEFQIATVNFDLSTSLTTDGAINIVTRSGGNNFHGGGFYFYRDHNMAAYPGLQRDPTNPDPFFQRDQFGFVVSGPMRKNRAFFFTNYERNDQRGVLSIQPQSSDFAPLGGIFPSPFLGNQFNVRFDVSFNRNHNGFLRYTHDGNSLFGPSNVVGNALPAGWSRIGNRADQSIIGLTSVLSASLVNDLRFSYFYFRSTETPADADDCSGCLGVRAPRILIPDAGVAFGTSRWLVGPASRFELTDSLIWQTGSQRLRIGFDFERNNAAVSILDQEPAVIEVYSPRQVRNFNATQPLAVQISLPSSFLTLDNILRLPLKSFVTAVGPGLAPIERGFRTERVQDLYRLYVADTWQIHPRLTLNYGLAWSFEPHSLNVDLNKPNLLTAILGVNNLNPPLAQRNNFAPTMGFAWAVHDGKTVIRGGAGRYFDFVSFNSLNITLERFALSPAGTGRRSTPGSAIFYQGRALDFPQAPTSFTAADLLAILPGIRADLLAQLNPNNRDFSFRNLNLDKTGAFLSDPFYETPYGLHFGLGVQRELASNLVLTADFVWRRFLHTVLAGIDYNRFRRPQGPVIRACTAAQRSDLSAVCSGGPITFDNTTGIAQYKGLLVRLNKRFSRRTQFLGSYALGSFKGSNGPAGFGVIASGFNNENWFENYGPLPSDLRHTLNLSGFVDLPSRFQISFSVSAYSRPPFLAYVSGMDFNGDGTVNDLLPGTTVNQFNRGLGKEDLVRLLQSYNQTFAGKRTVGGQLAPALTLPTSYSFNDNFFTQDLRLSRTFIIGDERTRLMLFGEVFNLLNTANLVQYSGNLNDPASFGQPTARFNQVFGSGGPRAFQLGARLSF